MKHPKKSSKDIRANRRKAAKSAYNKRRRARNRG